MTIKPILLAGTAKRGVVGPDASNTIANEEAAHSNSECSTTSSAGANDAPVLAHRNAVIERNDRRANENLYDEPARNQRTPRSSGTVRAKRQSRIDQNLDRLISTSGSSICPTVGGILRESSDNNNAAVSVVGNLNTTATNCNTVGAAGSNNSVSNLLIDTSDSGGVVEASSGYNSGDEHVSNSKQGHKLSDDEWKIRDEKFFKLMAGRGFQVQGVEEDGACLFRAISLQIYGDEGMHDVVRQNTMDYVYKNREYFCHFVTEDIDSYVKRKRRTDSHGNHIEIQAMSEIFNRPVEVYCYEPTPINIFNSEQLAHGYAPLRLSYQRGSHYNAILDPYNATVGVGLGLAGYKPKLQTDEAQRLSEELAIEQNMFEDKLKTTDWEATNDAIEEQIARESYLQWCRDNLNRSQQRRNNNQHNVTATVTSAQMTEAASSTQHTLATTTSTSSSTNSPVRPKANSCEIHTTDAEDEPEGDAEADSSTNTSTDSDEKKDKTAGINNGSKKRRRDNNNYLTHTESIETVMDGVQSLTSRKNPKHGKSTASNEVETDVTDVEQPSTSKQSTILPEQNTPECVGGATVAENKTATSNLYAELLEASFSVNDATGSLSESEMLQRAIQMSREDYLQAQKCKFIYNMGNNEKE